MNWMVEYLLVACWVFFFPLALIAYLTLWSPTRRSIPLTFVLLGIWIVCFMAPFRWRPLRDAMGFSEIRYGVDLAPYYVEFINGPGPLDRDRYFLVTRADGQQRRSPIDGDANACIDFSVRNEGSRIAFVCAGEQNPSTIDTQAQTLTSGWSNTTTRIEELFY